MEKQIFRKKSVERVSSPEQLSDYIGVSNPSVWMTLAAIIVLLAGVCVLLEENLLLFEEILK